MIDGEPPTTEAADVESRKPERRSRPGRAHPFRSAVLRGLGVVLPPLLTIVVFLWAWNLISRYVLEPVEHAVGAAIVWKIWDVPKSTPQGTEAHRYQQLPSGAWIPETVYREVHANPGDAHPETPQAYYERYVRIIYLPRTRVIPLFILLFVLLLYFMGRFLAAGMGRWLWTSFESLIQRVPVIRNVYSSVKQVTDFVFSEQEIQFNRVVAVEYPRRGIWSIGFVTGESILDIRSAANEPVLSVLIPTSPMPATGFTITVSKSETIDLDITVDEAIQVIVSCGVVIPAHQQYDEKIASQLRSTVASRLPSQPSEQ